eukprot:Gb_23986 [translate_table: standard]
MVSLKNVCQCHAADLPGWPLLSPSKVQMLKCEKCSREFCSPVNHRRHIRLHRRPLNVEKDDLCKKRAHLAEFWDKLSVDEARQIVSFKNIMLEEVPGASIVKAMTSFIRKPGLPSLPQFYIKAGAALLDVVQTKSSRFPLPSKDLFSILDDASEKTFLCAGTAVSVQKFVFAGEAGKVGLEVRNLVASMGFLVEQKLIKAWLVDKDAEALRCQKLLVEEEEAAEKKRVELLERKRRKKLRQKELKEKEQAVNVDSVDGGGSSSPDFGEDGSLTATDSSPSSSFSEHDLSNQEQSGDVNIIDVQRSGKDDNSILRLFEQNAGQDGKNFIDKDTVMAQNGIVLDTGHIVSTDTDLESRASQGSAAEVPVYPELDCSSHRGGQDKTYVDRKFVRGWRERKSYIAERKDQQNTLKLRKFYNGLSSWQASPGGETISRSVSGQRLGRSDKTLGRRTTPMGNGCRIWTKKTQQTPRSGSDKAVKSEEITKNNMDITSGAKPVEPVRSLSDASYNGPTCQDNPEGGQKGLDTTKSDFDRANYDSDPVYQSESKAINGELLIGSVSVCLQNLPNGLLQPRLVRCGVMTDSELLAATPDKNLCGECVASTEKEVYNSSSSGFASSEDSLMVSDAVEASASNSAIDVCDKTYKPPHQGPQGNHEKFAKQGYWQTGANKAGSKFWRPVGLVVDRHNVMGPSSGTLSSVNGNKYEIATSISDSKDRVAIGAAADWPLKLGPHISENMKHPLCNLQGDVFCGDDVQTAKQDDNDHGGREHEETIDRLLNNGDGTLVSNCTREVHEHFNSEHNEIIETISQRESKILSNCDAAATFLSQRWEDAIADGQMTILRYPDYGIVEGTAGASDGGILEARDEAVSSIEEVQGRQKSVDDRALPLSQALHCGSGGTTRLLSAECGQMEKSHETGIGVASKTKFGFKSEKNHLKYIPIRRDAEEKNVTGSVSQVF